MAWDFKNTVKSQKENQNFTKNYQPSELWQKKHMSDSLKDCFLFIENHWTVNEV